mgnify:FL=1
MEENQGKNEEKTEQILNNYDEKKVISTKSNIAKKIWNIFMKIITIIIAFISIIIVVQKVTNNKQAFLGYRIFRVQTGSMIPKYEIGDVILVKEQAIDKIKVGDDVTYLGKDGVVKGILITHRVKNIEEIEGQKVFHTQGIANNLEDPVVYGDQINGVVQSKMYILTLICKMLNNKYIFYFCGILPLTIYVFFKVFKNSRDKYENRIEKDWIWKD